MVIILICFLLMLPTLLNQNYRLGATFRGNYMKQKKLGYYYGSVINIYVVYKLNDFNNSEDAKVINTTTPDFTTQNSLFRVVKIIKDTNTSHYKYTGYGICFDEKGSFYFGNRTDAKNVTILGGDMVICRYSGNNYTGKNNMYVLGKNFIQGFSTDGAGHKISQKGMYKTNITGPNKKFVLALHYNGDDSYLFVNRVQQLKFKSAISHTDRNLLTLGNISLHWSLTN